jgi:hypothetical protein
MGKYPFNLPWPAIIVGVVFYAAIATYFLNYAREFAGVLRWVLILLSALFASLGIILGTRRLFFPRLLEVNEEAILFPHGFPRTRTTRIPYDEIVRICELGRSGELSLLVFTARGQFDIGTSYLPDFAAYQAIRASISARSPISLSPPLDPARGNSFQEFPPPLLKWTEPEDWPRYRTYLVTSKPLAPRVLSAFWFFLRSFVIILLPWLLLGLLDLPASSTAAYLGVDLVVSCFFTYLHWLNRIWPVHTTEISIRERGITQNFGKQVWDRTYHEITAWRIIERSFENRPLHILLLEAHKRITAIALPDATFRDRMAEMLNAKHIQRSDDLNPPWELQ